MRRYEHQRCTSNTGGELRARQSTLKSHSITHPEARGLITQSARIRAPVGWRSADDPQHRTPGLGNHSERVQCKAKCLERVQAPDHDHLGSTTARERFSLVEALFRATRTKQLGVDAKLHHSHPIRRTSQIREYRPPLSCTDCDEHICLARETPLTRETAR